MCLWSHFLILDIYFPKGKLDVGNFCKCFETLEITWKLGAESPNNPHGVKLAIKQIDFMQKLAYMLGYQELNSIKSGGTVICFFRI